MPCDSQRNRKQDKKTAWDDAKATVVKTTAAVLIAEAAVYGFCASAIASGGALSPACIAAMVALGIAVSEDIEAVLKSENARTAYNIARGEYDNCMSKLRPASQ